MTMVLCLSALILLSRLPHTFAPSGQRQYAFQGLKTRAGLWGNPERAEFFARRGPSVTCALVMCSVARSAARLRTRRAGDRRRT